MASDKGDGDSAGGASKRRRKRAAAASLELERELEAFNSLVGDESELSVELSLLPTGRRRTQDATSLVNKQLQTTALAAGTGMGGLNSGKGTSTGTGTITGTDEGSSSSVSPFCDLGERLRLARDRSQLCYWFNLLDQSASKTTSGRANKTIGGSLGNHEQDDDHDYDEGQPSIETADERLIEAELLLFKLKPDPSLLKRQQQQPLNSSNLGEQFHLRTNLLEVSLYQILPKKSDQSENPLRLLDIRRIDLESSGWESFYVKRAVQDWLSDSSSNLGLVIKAKSMFDEPIRIGLIRFADLYDHFHYRFEGQKDRTSSAADSGHREAAEFDLSHQPALVIYTSSSVAAAAADQTDLESNG